MKNDPGFDSVDAAKTGCDPVPQVVSPSNHKDSFPAEPQISLGDTLSGLSLEQLKCPVVIEVFCGSAGVTAALRAVGIRLSVLQHWLPFQLAVVSLLRRTSTKKKR